MNSTQVDNTLEIVFTVWKPTTTSSQQYILVGNNSLSLTTNTNRTKYTLAVPRDDKSIIVEPGYVIGVYISTGDAALYMLQSNTTHSTQYTTYYIDRDDVLPRSVIDDRTILAADRVINQIPLVSAKIGQFLQSILFMNVFIIFFFTQ